MKNYKVKFQTEDIIKAKNEEDAEKIFWDRFENSFWKAEVKEIKEDKKMKNYNVEIKNNGIYINDILIDESIFQEEKCGYSVQDRENQINDLYMWIGEATGSDRANDLYLMKEDLRYLENIRDEIIFSSIGTNDFIAKSDDEETFNSICEEILKLNEEIKNGSKRI